MEIKIKNKNTKK